MLRLQILGEYLVIYDVHASVWNLNLVKSIMNSSLCGILGVKLISNEVYWTLKLSYNYIREVYTTSMPNVLSCTIAWSRVSYIYNALTLATRYVNKCTYFIYFL